VRREGHFIGRGQVEENPRYFQLFVSQFSFYALFGVCTLHRTILPAFFLPTRQRCEIHGGKKLVEDENVIRGERASSGGSAALT
jgi:hypothetical protein